AVGVLRLVLRHRGDLDPRRRIPSGPPRAPHRLPVGVPAGEPHGARQTRQGQHRRQRRLPPALRPAGSATPVDKPPRPRVDREPVDDDPSLLVRQTQRLIVVARARQELVGPLEDLPTERRQLTVELGTPPRHLSRSPPADAHTPKSAAWMPASAPPPPAHHPGASTGDPAGPSA